MKILLVNPPAFLEETYSEYVMGAPELPPLGIGYLASMVRHEHDVRILDCVALRMGPQMLAQEVERWSPEVVCFTSTTISYLKAAECIRRVKGVDKGIVTLLGGVHINACPEQTMTENPLLDYGVVGEGEITFLQLIQALDRGSDIKKVVGIGYHEDGKLRWTAPRPLITDVDSIPFPSRDLFGDLSIYSETATRGSGVSLNLITSRGCPYSCKYCDQWMFGRGWRAHGPAYVLEEIDHLVNEYGATHLSFHDDTFTIRKERTIEIAKRLAERDYDVQFSICARPETLDDGTLAWLKRAGCFIIYLGIESGNPEMLSFIRRSGKEVVETAIHKIKSHGIKAYGSFILGFPKETKQTAQDTIDFAKSLPLDGVSFNVFTPFPKTELAEIAEDYGTVRKEWEYYSDHAPKLSFVPTGWTEEELLALQKRAYRGFYMRPRAILQNLHRLKDPHFVRKGIDAVRMFYKPKKRRRG